MKRLAWIASWKRVGLHAGLLAGLGLAFVGGSEKPATAQDDECPSETGCSFKKPNILLVMDWSSSMNWVFAEDRLPTNASESDRWSAAENAIVSMLDAQNGFFDENLHFALMRYGSVSPCALGSEPVVLDIGWYDDVGADKTYFECNGQAIKDALNGPITDPPNPGVNGCLTWTGEALNSARDYINQSKTDHPEDTTPGAERFYGVIVVTDGVWNGPGGSGSDMNPRDPADDPGPIAADLFNNEEIPTYVIAMSTETDALADANDLADNGGTMAALDGSSSTGVEDAMQTIIDDIRNSVIVPTCIEGQPRVMIVLDASSSMLQGDRAGRDTGWDQARSALAGTNSIFDVEINMGASRAEDLMLLGLIVFGGEMPAEEKLLVQYGPCMKDNFAWALDPLTACGPSGNCTDPWTQMPPIQWDFKTSPPSTFNGAPPFNVVTRNHIPQCQSSGFGDTCSGSATFTHRGLEMAFDNLRWYQQNNPAGSKPFPTSANTQFINILITDGNYTGYSTDAEVQNSLQVMEADGVTTYVIGFGDNISQNLLDNMADWGSGGAVGPFDASTQADLETALATILENVNFDPCCELNDCAATPEVDYDSETFGETDGTVPDFQPTTGGGGTTTGGDDTTGGDNTTSGGGDTTGGDPTTGGGGTTSGSGGGSTGGDPSTSGGSDGSGGSTGGDGDGDGDSDATASASGTGGDGDGDGDSETGNESDSDTGESDSGDSCNCSTDDDGTADPRGLLSSVLLVGLGGLLRRRRRS